MSTLANTAVKNVMVHQEDILVVKASRLFTGARVQGIDPVIDPYMERIKQHHEFLPRALMELDAHYKQIIPYIIFMHGNSIFLMQRAATAGEARLKNKYTVGIGGHMRSADMQGGDIFSWAQREFHEEVVYKDPFTITPIGLLNDDSNEVGKVHAGLILLLEGSTSNISINSELASGVMVPLETCIKYYDLLENWSKIVIDFLRMR